MYVFTLATLTLKVSSIAFLISCLFACLSTTNKSLFSDSIRRMHFSDEMGYLMMVFVMFVFVSMVVLDFLSLFLFFISFCLFILLIE